MLSLMQTSPELNGQDEQGVAQEKTLRQPLAELNGQDEQVKRPKRIKRQNVDHDCDKNKKRTKKTKQSKETTGTILLVSNHGGCPSVTTQPLLCDDTPTQSLPCSNNTTTQPLPCNNTPIPPLPCNDTPTQPSLCHNAPTQSLTCYNNTTTQSLPCSNNTTTQPLLCNDTPTPPLPSNDTPTQPSLCHNAPTQSLTCYNIPNQPLLCNDNPTPPLPYSSSPTTPPPCRDLWYDNYSDDTPDEPSVGVLMSMLVKINEDQKTIMQFYKDMKDDQQKLLSKVARIEDHLDITQYLPTTVLPVHDDGSNFINTIPCITEAPTATSLDIDPVPTPPHSSGTAQDQRATVTPVPAPPRGNEISGSSIITSQLTPVESALQRYSSWLIDSKFSALAIKLAREVFFGDNVLR